MQSAGLCVVPECAGCWSAQGARVCRVLDCAGCRDVQGAGVCGPLHCLLPQINLLIFMRILKVILAKLRANQKGYADYKLR